MNLGIKVQIMAFKSQVKLAVLLLSILSMILPVIGAQRNIDEWRSRTIYQVITDRFAVAPGEVAKNCIPSLRRFCGGTYKGIESKLDYIKDMGFDAIWISPVTTNTDGNPNVGDPYHGYWTTEYTVKDGPFGKVDDLKSLIKAAHKKDIWIMADVTVNNMAQKGPHDQIDYSKFKPFNRKEDYHPYCPMNYENQTSVYFCWDGTDNMLLVDLKTESPRVKEETNKYVKNLVSDFDFDGVRIDALKNIPADFYPDVVKSANVYTTGELFSNDTSFACDYQNKAVDGFLNFPLYYGILPAFQKSNLMSVLRTKISELRSLCRDTTLLNPFLDNHDVERFAFSAPDQAKILNALTFVFLWEGIPVMYYGTEQHLDGSADPFNREALWMAGYDETNPYYTLVRLLNAVRKFFSKDINWLKKQADILEDTSQQVFQFQRGDLMVYTNNYGNVESFNETSRVEALLQTKYKGGLPVVDALSTEEYTTDSDGSLRNVRVKNNFPLIFMPKTLYDQAKLPKMNMTKVKEQRKTPQPTEYYQPPYSNSHLGTGKDSSSGAVPVLSGSALAIGIIVLYGLSMII